MTAQAILNDLLQAGIRPRLTPDGCGIVVPKGAITEALKVAIRANKSALLRLLSAPADTTEDRSNCPACTHFHAIRKQCLNYRRAGLTEPSVAAAIAHLQQRCPGHTANPNNHTAQAAPATTRKEKP